MMSNRQAKQIEWIAEVIRKSGIATKTQREAIIVRIKDAANERATAISSISEQNSCPSS